MRFIIGLVLGVLLGWWLGANDYQLRMPFEPAQPELHDDGGTRAPKPAAPRSRPQGLPLI